MKILTSILTALACTTVMAGQCSEQKPRKNGKNVHMFEQGDETLPAAAPAAYNAPAGVVLKKNYPDLYVDLSFLYYYASQDQMDIAASVRTVGVVPTQTNNSQVLTQDFDYKPAFKIGFGGNVCEWQIGGEYTWIRQTTKTDEKALTPVPVSGGTGAWLLGNWFVQQDLMTATELTASNVSSEWNLQLDIGDLIASRPFYEGRKLVLSPFFGFRTAWIRQKMEIDATIAGVSGVGNSTPESTTSSNSWAVGPRAGFGASALLGFGFHLEGTGAISLLYTEYTTVKHREQLVVSGDISSFGPSIGLRQAESTQVVRPELDMSLGFGWGSYLGDQQFHLDFSASYDFTIFWDQNMMRALLSQQGGYALPSASPGDLYLQGLRLTTRFDF